MDEMIEQFRIDFPEFTDDEKFTDGMIAFWFGIGDKLVDKVRFLTDSVVRRYALSLWIAHHIIMQYNNQVAVASGNYTGEGIKPAVSYHVGDVSITYDGASFMEADGGDWNTTIYGRKLLRLVRNLAVAYQV
jgi:hypothetical protein